MTAAAMLVYPDVFKAGFSESGNHENNIYNNTWRRLDLRYFSVASRRDQC